MLYKGDCEGCDEAPTIFLTQIVNGELRKHNLCRDCPHKMEIQDPAGFALADMLLKLSDKAAAAPPAPCATASTTAPAPRKVTVAGTCGCGLSLAEFERTQHLGCPDCYNTFQEQIMPTIKCHQKRGCTHRGKVPASAGGRRVTGLSREALERQLEDAVSHEDFETAARTRDLLRQLDRGFGGR